MPAIPVSPTSSASTQDARLIRLTRFDIEQQRQWASTRHAQLRRLYERIQELQAKAQGALDCGGVVTHEWINRFSTLQADFVRYATITCERKRGFFAHFKTRFARDIEDIQQVAKLTNQMDDLFLELLFSRKPVSTGDDDRDSVSTTASSS